MNYTSGGIAELALAAISMSMIVVVCMFLSDRKMWWLATVGSTSLAIYLLHILVASGSRILLMKLFHIDSLALTLAVGTVVGVLVPIAIFLRADTLGIQFLFNVPVWLSLQQKVALRKNQSARGTR
jgi:peptidoglycan/LPS O-acetylase OafA/YrhL